MNYPQPIIYALDDYIQRAQQRIYDGLLLSRWGLDSSNTLNFGRVYRNHVNDGNAVGYIPEAYYNGQYISSSGTSNRGGLFFESGKVILFWGTIDSARKQSNADYLQRLELICFADMTVVKPGGYTTTTQRLDEVLAADLENFITFDGCGFSVSEVTRDIDKVLERYSGSAKKLSLSRDMSGNNNAAPSFCAIKLTLELRYNPATGTGSTNTQPLPMNRSITLFIKASPDPSKTIAVGNGNTLIYQEYAPTNALTPMTTTGKPYLQGLAVTFISFDNQPDALALSNGSYSQTFGTWDRTLYGGNPYAYNDGDFVNFIFNDLT